MAGLSVEMAGTLLRLGPIFGVTRRLALGAHDALPQTGADSSAAFLVVQQGGVQVLSVLVYIQYVLFGGPVGGECVVR